ncbi:hypothetical protein MMC28_001672 [Mycoblastus sanguinarius]|nr:hypothetical protein [Mycoblastus sanguinarius]
MDYVEYALSWLFMSQRNHDASLFTTNPAFSAFPTPTIDLTSPDCGPSGSTFDPDYTQLGTERFPELTWTVPPSLEVKEYVLICEDADLPLGGPIFRRLFHGLFYAIPRHVNRVTADDVDLRHESGGGQEKVLKGGFRFVSTVYKNAYVGPKPLLGHGPHRYFYELVALGEPLDLGMLGEVPTKAKVAEAIEGKVVGWGVWVGSFERRWE